MLWFPAYTRAWLGRDWRDAVDNPRLTACLLNRLWQSPNPGHPSFCICCRPDNEASPLDIANLLLMLVFLLHFTFSVSLLLIPPLAGDYGQSPGLGLLRLHSTFRHDLKIYASDEGRVQMTAAAFAKVGRFSYRRSSRSAQFLLTMWIGTHRFRLLKQKNI